jgi:hypothetical protein
MDMTKESVRKSEPDNQSNHSQSTSNDFQQDEPLPIPAFSGGTLASQILHLQRTIGNQAVMRLLDQQKAARKENRVTNQTQEPVVQRLLGFEFETNFPAANLTRARDQGGRPGEVASSTRLRKYLSGQAYAKDAIHNFAALGFQAEADHAGPSTAIENARQNINYRMSIVPHPPHHIRPIRSRNQPIHPKPGIVEYKTNAFDESTLAGITALTTAIQNLAAHLTAVHGQITPGIANPPLSSPGWLVGIPPQADWTTFGARYGISAADMATQYNNVLNTINQDIYPQVTVGVLPKNIPAFFNQTQHAGMTQGQDANLQQVTANLSQLRVSDAEAVARKALKDVQGKATVNIDADTVGYITLIAQYVFGSLVHSQEHFAIVKNMPVFMSKTPLTNAQQTIVAVGSRPAHWSAAAQQRLVSKLWKYASEAYNAQVPATRVTRNTERSFTQADALAILATDNGPDPWSNPKAGIAMLATDPHRYNVAFPSSPGAPVANRAIVLEFRALQNIANPAALAAWAANMVNLLWAANQNQPNS